MNLKESFRYQTAIDSIVLEVARDLSDKENLLEITKTHLRSKSYPEAVDEVEVIKEDDAIPGDTLLGFMKALVDEKCRLSEAITKAKASIGFDIDAAIASNKIRRSVSKVAREMCNNRSHTEKGRSSAYKFNEAGDQTVYYYDTIVEYKEIYDRNAALKTARDFASEADEVSAKIELALVSTEVDYEPKFDASDSFDDIIEDYVQTGW